LTVNLRHLAEQDLGESIEKEWALNVNLIDPDGVIYTGLKAQVLNFTQQEDPETGQPVIINKPVISLRISSLTRVPQPGEKWIIQYPEDPTEGASLVDAFFSPSKAPEDGTDIGFMRIYPQSTEQES
jgi:hypothetical protein